MKKNDLYSLKKRFLALSLALSLGAPLTASANTGKDNGNDNSKGTYSLVLQEENKQQMTIDEYALGVGKSLDYLRGFIDYDHMPQDLQCLY